MRSTRTAKTTACLAVLLAMVVCTAGAPGTAQEDDMPWGFAGRSQPSILGATAANGDMPWG